METKQNVTKKWLIEQIYTGCLAQGAYYILSEGEVAIIDPLREVAPYINKAVKDNASIKYIFETHFHADFVSGHVDLAKQTGAEIIFGPNAVTDFKSTTAVDGQEFKIGAITIKVLHTPGHTMESVCYLLIDENNESIALFTGDTLFIGDVGRPDLAVKSDLSKDDLAGFLYESLNNKILPLSDSLIIYPGHGAGSACGKNMSKERSDTLGNQRKTNYALNTSSKQEFIQKVTEGILPPPNYFPKNVLLNKMGYSSIESVLKQGTQALTVEAFQHLAQESLILDTRKPADFANGHISGAINIGIDGQFAPWVGALITDLNQEIILVTEIGKEEESVTRLSRVGFDNTKGFLEGGMEAWIKAGLETDMVNSITATELAELLKTEKINVLDVRKPNEFLSQHLVIADSKPLDYINDWVNQVSTNEKYYIHCAGGYRSMITISILKARGFHNLVDIQGGFSMISQTDAELTSFVCPSTLV